MKKILFGFLFVSAVTLAMNSRDSTDNNIDFVKKLDEEVQAKRKEFFTAIRQGDFEKVKALHNKRGFEYGTLKKGLEMAQDENITRYLIKFYKRIQTQSKLCKNIMPDPFY